jgi:polyisoprenoid-binding protein YceI
MSIRPSRPLLAAALVAALALPLAANAALKVDGKPKVSFLATGSPGFLDIEGVTNTVSATDDGTKLSFTVPMASVKTGIDLRDEHMNDKYVQVAQFPNAVLVLDKAGVQFGTALAEKKSGSVTGQFAIHGVAKPVTVAYTTQKSKTGWRVTANFTFDVSQHGIEIPAYLGVTVDPKMKSEVTLDLVDAP